MLLEHYILKCLTILQRILQSTACVSSAADKNTINLAQFVSNRFFVRTAICNLAL